MPRPARTLLALALAGCAGDKAGGAGEDSAAPCTEGCGDTGEDSPVDADGDGWPEGEDCDDRDPSVHPGAEEVCDGGDDDCDGEVDEGLGTTVYTDADGDGYGDPDTARESCEDEGVDNGEDCDDGDAAVHPGAEEICDGLDQDCDGEIDEGATSTFYADADGDGYGDPDSPVEACEADSGLVDNAEDCDDSDRWVNPGVASDACNARDDDCDGDTDEDVKSGWILVTVDGGDDAVYEIDPATATMSWLSDLDDPSLGNINSMDVSEDEVAIIHSYTTAQLVEIDVCTGETEAIGPTGVGNTNGISFDADHALWGIDTDGDQLVSYDTSTGKGTAVGSLGFSLGNGGLAYDCATDTLYGVDGSSGDIFELDRSTGAASGFVSTSVPFSAVGIEFDHGSRLLYASTGTALYEVDPTTGSSSLVGSMSTAEGVNDLAFHPPCP